MNTLLNHNGKQATINVNTAHDKENNAITSALTWDELTDSNKQDIASEWIRDHIHTNVNQVMDLLAENEEHDDYYDYLDLSESKDFTNAVESDLHDKTIDELMEIIEEYDLDNVGIDSLMAKHKITICSEIENNTIKLDDLINTVEELNLFYISPEKRDMIDLVMGCIKDDNTMTNDELETIFINLGLPVEHFKNIEKATKSDLITLTEKELDYNQYGCDNALEPECDQAYEFYSVSDHFKAMLPENCEDLLGLTVWARFCTGQSICLDRQVQLAAFKVLSDCSYKYY